MKTTQYYLPYFSKSLKNYHSDHGTLWYRVRQMESSGIMKLIQKTAEEMMLG